MSLYRDAVSILRDPAVLGGSLQSRIYRRGSEIKSAPAAVYALISETSKYATLIKEVVDKAGILALESKVSPGTLSGAASLES